MLKTAVILAGGFGTRLQSVIKDVPKPMAPINGKPFLHYQLLYLKQYGIQHIIFSVGHLHQVIENYFGKTYLNLSIHYVLEDTPMGTGGGIRLALQNCEEKEALVLNGDSFFDCDLNEFFHLHATSQASCSLALRKVSNASRYGTIECDATKQIISFKEKSNAASAGIINTGIYIINQHDYLLHTPAKQAFSIEKDFFEKKLQQLPIMGFEFEGYFIDIGLPEDYKQAQHDFERFKYR